MVTKAEWTERVKRWGTSGLGREELAEGEGINAKRLTWWRWKLRAYEHRQISELHLGILATVKGALYELVVNSGMSVLLAVLEQEREKLCGVRYQHDATRAASRAGYADGEVVLGGRRVSVKRPRARSNEGKEILLPSWEKFAAADPLNARAVEQRVIGVATRKYARSLESAPTGMKSRGTSKSAVSRRFVAATQEKLSSSVKGSLADLPLAAIMIVNPRPCSSATFDFWSSVILEKPPRARSRTQRLARRRLHVTTGKGEDLRSISPGGGSSR